MSDDYGLQGAAQQRLPKSSSSADEARKRGSARPEAGEARLPEDLESRMSAGGVPRVGGNHRVVGDEVSAGHCVEELAGVAEGAAFRVEGEEVVEEEGRGAAGGGDDDEGVELASLAKGTAGRGGATLEEGGCYRGQRAFAIMVERERGGSHGKESELSILFN